MGERKGQNKYYPPDFDPKKTNSLNQYHGVHALRERARKLDQGILIIRFEAPWNFFCTGCGSHVGRGVRYNAEKSKVGMYYTTPIWQFKMRCHLCGSTILFETDPKEAEYKITAGGKRRTETWDPKDTETIELPDREEILKRQADPMYKMEHVASDKQRAAEHRPMLEQLILMNEDRVKYAYEVNSVLRREFREEKKRRQVQAATDQALLDKASINIPLLPEREEDIQYAKSKVYGKQAPSTAAEMEKERKAKIKHESIFAGTATPRTTSTTSSRGSTSTSTSGAAQGLNRRKEKEEQEDDEHEEAYPGNMKEVQSDVVGSADGGVDGGVDGAVAGRRGCRSGRASLASFTPSSFLSSPILTPPTSKKGASSSVGHRLPSQRRFGGQAQLTVKNQRLHKERVKESLLSTLRSSAVKALMKTPPTQDVTGRSSAVAGTGTSSQRVGSHSSSGKSHQDIIAASIVRKHGLHGDTQRQAKARDHAEGTLSSSASRQDEPTTLPSSQKCGVERADSSGSRLVDYRSGSSSSSDESDDGSEE